MGINCLDWITKVHYKDNIFKNEKFPWQFKKGDKIKFVGIQFFYQVDYYLELDNETIYEIENIHQTDFKLKGIDKLFIWASFIHATTKEIRKEKLNALQSKLQ